MEIAAADLHVRFPPIAAIRYRGARKPFALAVACIPALATWMHYPDGAICREAAFRLLPLRSGHSVATMCNLDGRGMQGW